MTILQSIFVLLGGSGLFLTASHIIDLGIKPLTQKLSLSFCKLGDRKWLAYLIGAGSTALIQSSDATVMISIGFVNNGISSLCQAMYIALGARLGTTITAVLLACSSLSITPAFMSLSLVGIIMVIFTNKNVKTQSIGYVLVGFAMLFSGLYLMTQAIRTNSNTYQFFIRLFTNLDSPPLLFSAGSLFAALLQSSSAVIGVIIVMLNVGTLEFGSSMFLIIGATVGTTLGPLAMSMGGGQNGKRLGFLYAITAMISAIAIGLPIWIFKDKIIEIFECVSSSTWRATIFDIVYSAVASLSTCLYADKLIVISQKLIKKYSAHHKKQSVI